MSEPVEQIRKSMALRKQADQIGLRPATLSDLDAMVKIEQSSFPAPWPRSVIAGEIDGRSWSRVTVVTCDNSLVGYMVYWIVTTEVHLLNLAVDPGWRRSGVANQLLSHLIETSRNQKLEEILLEVRVSNDAARNLYRQFHFEELGTRPNYYSDNHEDAIVMALQLSSDPSQAR